MINIKQCLILAAGNGTRLRTDIGRPAQTPGGVRGRPILEHVVLRAQEAGSRNS